MKKLLILFATVLLSINILLIGINQEEKIGLYCNEVWNEISISHSYSEEITPITDWQPHPGDTINGHYILWRAVKYLGQLTCVELKAIPGKVI